MRKEGKSLGGNNDRVPLCCKGPPARHWPPWRIRKPGLHKVSAYFTSAPPPLPLSSEEQQNNSNVLGSIIQLYHFSRASNPGPNTVNVAMAPPRKRSPHLSPSLSRLSSTSIHESKDCLETHCLIDSLTMVSNSAGIYATGTVSIVHPPITHHVPALRQDRSGKTMLT